MSNDDQRPGWVTALVSGLGWGLVLAALDPALAGALRAGYVRDLGAAGLFALIIASLLIYVPAMTAAAMVLWLLLGRRSWGAELSRVALASAPVWLVLMSKEPAQHLRGLVTLAAMNGVAALAAGFGLTRLVSLLPRVSPRRGLLRIVSGYLLVLAGLNFSLGLVAGREIRFLFSLILISLIAMVMIAVWAWLNYSQRRTAAFLIFLFVTVGGLGSPWLLWSREKSEPIAAIKPAAKAPNLIIIVADALRADAITPERTPNLWRLKQQGLSFENAQSAAPWTVPAVMGLLTGREPIRFRKGFGYRVPPQVPLLAQDLARRGYLTSALVGAVILSPETGLFRGFQEVVVKNHMLPLDRFAVLPILAFLDHYGRSTLGLREVPDRTRPLIDLAIRRLMQAAMGQERPLFLYLHLMDPHDPYSPPPEFSPHGYRGVLHNPFTPRNAWHVAGDRRDPQMSDLREGRLRLGPKDKEFVRELYLGEVAYLDQQLGRLFAELKDGVDFYGRPVILVFTADHGEEFWEHDDWGHGQSLYQELLHVPLIFYGAGFPPARVTTLASHLLLLPTLRDLLGLPPDPGVSEISFQAMNFEPARLETLAPFACSSETFFFNARTALFTGPEKVVHDLFTGHFTYFNLSSDPKEKFPADALKIPQGKALSEILRAWEIQEQQAQFFRAAPSARDPETERRLQAMGYIR